MAVVPIEEADQLATEDDSSEEDDDMDDFSALCFDSDSF